MAEAAGPSTGGAGVDTKSDDEHFVDKHQSGLIKRVSDVEPILNELLRRNVIQLESYDKIKTLPTAEEKMRELISGPLESSGVQGKDIFYEILIENQPLLIQDLETMDAEVETMSTKRRICETLNDLSSEELEKFKSLIEPETGFPLFSRKQLEVTKTQDLVELMVETYSRQYLELTKRVLKLMNRTDLVQRLIDTCKGTKEKHRPSLIQRVETLESAIELLLETLKDLSEAELKMFRWNLRPVHHKGHSFFRVRQQKAKYIRFDRLNKADMQGTVCLMVQYCGQQSVEVTRESLKKMKRTDLVQRLSDSSSRPKKKLSVDELQSALIKKAAMMGAVKELLLETLNDLSYEEQKTFIWFLQFTFFQRSLPQIPWSRLLAEDMAELVVDVMVEEYGQKSVEVIREVLMDMNRADLVQRLSETSSGIEAAAGSSAEVFGVNTTEKERHSVEEDWPALIQKVESMESVIELLLETLKHLSVAELKRFKRILLCQPEFLRHCLRTSLKWLPIAHVQDTVFFMLQICGQKCLEKTEKILKTMKRTDLVRRLSNSSSGSKKKHSADEHRSALIHKVATVAAVQQLLLEILNDLIDMELEEFKNIMKSTVSKKNLPDISWMFNYRANIVTQMVQDYGQQSVELTWEVLMDMNRTDPLQRLSKPSSGLKDKHPPASSERESLTLPQEKLLETLKDFSPGDLEKFKHVLLYTKMKEDLPRIPRHQIETADRVQTVKLMVLIYGQRSEEVIREVFNKMNRRDLVQRLSDFSSGSEGPSRNLELDDCGSTMQDSSDWTKLKPKVNNTDADEAPTYSLQSEAGNFECSVSGLRWVCKEKVSFKYQFCSWEEPMERMEMISYMPAGPLMDITEIVGKLVEVYLPHWICIDDNPKILNKFAVLHIDDCGDVVEKVAEVTSSHVKLSEPVFSPRAVLMKVGFPVKISCDVLIYYQPNTPFLKLHVYLIPHDPALQQALDKKKFSKGFELIQKPRPDIYLKMQQGFNLAADMDTARIQPEKITLRYDSQDPNFYEVFIKKPDRDFHLTLSHIRKGKLKFEPVWTCEIRTVDYQSSAHLEVKQTRLQSSIPGSGDNKHSVDEHLSELMQKGATITTDREKLLNVLEQLKQQEFKEFKWFLQDSDILTGLPGIPHHRLEEGDMLDVVDLMLQTYSQQSVELTKKVFQKIQRNDLVQKL
ncbi:uncharacterized protein AB9X84_023968 [Acanthopagrus schlegelii]